MSRPFVFLAAIVVLALCPPVRAQDSGPLALLHQQDLRLARLAESMLGANSRLCRNLMPITGMIIHTRDQYGQEAVAGFENGPVAIAGIVPGSPADRADLAAGDAILSVDETDLGDLPPSGEEPLRDAVFDLIASSDSSQPLVLRIRRAGKTFDASLRTPGGCRALVEILAETKSVARADGRVIQLSYGLAQSMSDDGLAAAFAHELAHVVLEHRRRLSEAGVSKGLLGEFGSNQQRNRQVEVEADRLSVHLLANAGFDPRVAPAFWRSDEGRKVDSGLLRSWAYPSPAGRAKIMEREIALYLPLGIAPTYPGHLLARRDREF